MDGGFVSIFVLILSWKVWNLFLYPVLGTRGVSLDQHQKESPYSHVLLSKSTRRSQGLEYRRDRAIRFSIKITFLKQFSFQTDKFWTGKFRFKSMANIIEEEL